MKALADSLDIGKSLVRVRMGKPVVKDIPLLVRALRINDDYTRAHAHMWLKKLAGVDHGTDALAWREWWQRERPKLLRQEADETAAGVLFSRLRDAVMTGHWGTAADALSGDARDGRAARHLVSEMVERRQDLRTAFRDAKVSAVTVVGESGTVNVDWGETGFERDELPVVRERGRWAFTAEPWSGPLVERPASEAVHAHAPPRKTRRKRGPDSVTVQMAALLLIALVMGVVLAVKVYGVQPLTPLVVLLVAVPVALLLRKLLSRPRFRRDRGKLVH